MPSSSRIRLCLCLLVLVSSVRSKRLPSAGHHTSGGQLIFNCVEVSFHCKCSHGDQSTWGTVSKDVAMRYSCHHMCPLCVKAVERAKLSVATVEKDAQIYETNCGEMNRFCQCKGGKSADPLERDHCKLSCQVCEFADRNYREVHIRKKASDTTGVIRATTTGMLKAIAAREAELCKHRTEFGPWSGCTKSCGGGLRYRYRDTVLCWQYTGHETERPFLKKSAFEQHQQCNNAACPAGSAAKADLKHPQR
jgi:hypothetical protein